VNISYSEVNYDIIAKTCNCRETGKKVTYSFVDSSHGLCMDKKDIILSEIQACERLLKYTTEEKDKSVLENEIAQLKLTLDLLQ